MQVWRRFEFSSAHTLEGHPGACRNMHGHNYTLEVRVDGDVDPETGMVIDFDELLRAVDEQVLSRLDHAYLNDVMDIPTAENIARWVWGQLSSRLTGLAEITIYELSSCAVTYRGEHEP